jgi:hypothetical protein
MAKRKPVRNSPSKTGNKCPQKRANAFKTYMDGLAAVLRELKWTILAIVIIAAVILGVDLTLIAEAVGSAINVSDIGTLLLRQ